MVKPGLYELLHYLRRNGYKTAVASSTSRPIVMDNLCQAQVTDFFDFIICGDMVKHSKPNPEIYAIACRELGLAPILCLALEDSPTAFGRPEGAGDAPRLNPDMICAQRRDYPPLPGVPQGFEPGHPPAGANPLVCFGGEGAEHHVCIRRNACP